jgi:hypothetical protein
MLKVPGLQNTFLTSPLLPSSLLSVVLVAGIGFVMPYFGEKDRNANCATQTANNQAAPGSMAREENQQKARRAVPALGVTQPTPANRDQPTSASPSKPLSLDFVEDFPTAIPGL